MLKFERVGVNLQYDSSSKEQALQRFEYSCNCCCYKGMHIDCDRCAIAVAHQLVVASFDDKNKEDK